MNPLGLYGALLVGGWGGAALGGPGAVEPHGPPSADTVQAVEVSMESSSGIVVDGILDEDVWQEAQVLTGLRQQEPTLGEPATERTEVRVTYDRDAIFVGVTAFDCEPDEIIARIRQRDRIMQSNFLSGGLAATGDDVVAIVFDPFHDHRNGVVFATNPNGAEFDALITDEGTEINIDWRGTWEVEAAITPGGWSAEFSIPLRTLRYPGGEGQIWGFNVVRVIQRKKEQALWRSWSRDNGGFERISRAGHINGLDLPSPRPTVETKPYILMGSRQSATTPGVLDPAERDVDFGLDVKSEILPGLVLDATVNTDFAQVEVDDQRVNLTRFDLFFPEKREFFLENAGTFRFGVGGGPGEAPPFLMFFSRRIGISSHGEIPIMGGGRLTGRLGGQTVGLMHVRTEATAAVDPESFTVARVKRDVGNSGYLGGMFTNRRGQGASNSVAGADGLLYLTETFNVQGYASHSLTEGAGGDGLSYSGAFSYNAEEYALFGQHLAIDPDMRADLGFINRRNIRQSGLFGRRTFRPAALGVRKVDLWLGGSYVTPYEADDTSALDWSWGPFIGTRWESGEFLGINTSISETRLESGFRLADRVDIPSGVYDNNNLWISFSTSSSRKLSGSVSTFLSDFYGGSLKTVGGSVTLRPTASFSTTVGLNRNDVSVPGDGFVTNVSSLRSSFALSTRFTADALVQYNSLSREISSNVRLNFIHRPGSDLFVVFTENRGGDRVWDLSDRGLVMKLTYLARL